ncbi:uncharacterized protein LOC135539795 isoform X4 [Oncorhynchus masou masou]|uniref:uncharacterized protein LOC135539795 isoform X4 n=1 Tax=Oncorhynchus masou masou TaxID=90313 RepID=UPI0031831B46
MVSIKDSPPYRKRFEVEIVSMLSMTESAERDTCGQPFKSVSGTSSSERKVKMRANYSSEIRREAPLSRGNKKQGQRLSLSSMVRGQLQATPAPTVPPPNPATQQHLLTTPQAPSSEGASTKLNRGERATALDGSYLDLPTLGETGTNRGGRELNSGGRGAGGRVPCLSPASLSDDLHSDTPPPYSSSDQSQGPMKPLGSRGGAHSELRLASQRSRQESLVKGRFPHRGATEAPLLGNTSPLLHNGPGELLKDSRGLLGPGGLLPGEDPSGEGLEAEGALTAPLLGPEDWEERRHQLFLQKLQLEVERERLQARLAQQEERLIRQNQHLRHTRLDYSRFQQATLDKLSHSMSRNGTDPLPNSRALLSEMRGCDDAEDLAEEQEVPPHKDYTAHIPLQNSIHSPESCHNKSRRDIATSPVLPQSILKATPAPVMSPTLPRTPHARLDSSLIELLQVFSPISLPERNSPSAYQGNPTRCQPPLSVPKPARQALLSHPGPYQTPQQDLEESQILEEIFFIC